MTPLVHATLTHADLLGLFAHFLVLSLLTPPEDFGEGVRRVLARVEAGLDGPASAAPVL